MTEGELHSLISQLETGWIPTRDAEVKKNREENHHYSPLRSITIKETDHSRLLGELLKPDGSHGMGDLFLQSFLELIGINQPKEGKWQATVEKGRIDILLRRENPASVIIIENKANSAVDQAQQLYRYWYQEIYSYYPTLNYNDPSTQDRFKIIYAPARAFEKPSTSSLKAPDEQVAMQSECQTMPLELTYLSFNREISAWLESLVDQVPSSRLKVFLKL